MSDDLAIIVLMKGDQVIASYQTSIWSTPGVNDKKIEETAAARGLRAHVLDPKYLNNGGEVLQAIEMLGTPDA